MKRIAAGLLCLMLCAALMIAGCAVDAKPYSDVPADAWYAEAIAALGEKELMNGVGGGRFDPQGVFTRAQLAMVLYRMAGSPAVSGADDFTDTEAGKWYSDAVLWASQTGVVSGYGNGKYGTNDAVTQEQLAVMLWRSAGSYVLGEEYADANGVEHTASDYAYHAVWWARVDGLLTDAIAFEPQSAATRAQVADMVNRYLQLLEKFSNVDGVSSATKKDEDKMDEIEAIKPRCVLLIEAGGKRFYASFEDNSAAKALIEKLNSETLTVQMRDYGGFEKVGNLPWTLPQNDAQITAKTGDIILYNGNQITVYYGENTWSLTRLAAIGNVTREALLEALGEGEATVTFSLEWSE